MRAKTATDATVHGVVFAILRWWREAQTAGAGVRLAQAVSPDDVPPPRRRPPPRLRVTPYYAPDGVYPRYNPGPMPSASATPPMCRNIGRAAR